MQRQLRLPARGDHQPQAAGRQPGQIGDVLQHGLAGDQMQVVEHDDDRMRAGAKRAGQLTREAARGAGRSPVRRWHAGCPQSCGQVPPEGTRLVVVPVG